MVPAFHLHDGKPHRRDVGGEEHGLFADGHPVAERKVCGADETHMFRIRQRTVHKSAERHRAVEDHDLDILFGGGLQYEFQGGEVGVAPHADILKIHDETLQPLQHFRRGLARGAVKGEDGNPPARVAGVVRLLARCRKAEVAMLGGEHGLERAREAFMQHFAQWRCLLREQTEGLPVLQFADQRIKGDRESFHGWNYIIVGRTAW